MYSLTAYFEGNKSDGKVLITPLLFSNFVLNTPNMARIIVSLLFLALLSLPSLAQEQQVVVPYTLADRDRAIRTEANIEALEAKMEIKFEAVNARIDYLFWLQGVIVALILFMLGYMIWDRRTALQPALDRASDADAKSKSLILALKEYSQKHADLAEILKSHGIL